MTMPPNSPHPNHERRDELIDRVYRIVMGFLLAVAGFTFLKVFEQVQANAERISYHELRLTVLERETGTTPPADFTR